MSRQIKGVFIVFSITLFSYFVSCKSDSTEKHKLTEKFNALYSAKSYAKSSTITINISNQKITLKNIKQITIFI